MIKRLLYFIPLFLLLAALPAKNAFGQFYNGTQMAFGKNRIQYDEFLWQYYRFDKYDIYFYTGGKELAQYTAKVLPANISQLESIFDSPLQDRIQIIIYNKYSHFKQSNVGLGGGEQYNIGGVSRLSGSKIFVYYEGDHVSLENQIRHGIAEILVNDLMYGGNWRETLKNSTLLSLPDWYVKGLISYAANGNTPEIENRIKDGVLTGRYMKFNRLTGSDAIYAGHAMWKYIVEHYGAKVLPNVLYMTRISRNLESGFLFVLGISLKNLTTQWNEYYRTYYRVEDSQRLLPDETRIPIKAKKHRIYSQFEVSPDGKFAAFTTNELGQQRAYLYDIQKNKKKQLKKWNHKMERINDETYPLLGWHPTGKFLSMIMEEKGEMVLYYYSPETEKLEKRPIFNIEEVLDFGYSDDGKQLVFSAVSNGFTDIYIYNIGANTQQRLTNDIYDDLHPRFVNNSTGVIFSSNRTNDTIAAAKPATEIESKTKDIFIYSFTGKPGILKRITNTPGIDEDRPMAYTDDKYTYIARNNGVQNRFVAIYDSTISFIDTVTHYRYFTKTARLTNYSRDIIEHEFNPKAGKYSEMLFYKGRYNFYSGTINPDLSYLNFETSIPPVKTIPVVKAPLDTLSELDQDSVIKTTPNEPVIDINNYQFDNQKSNKDTLVTSKLNNASDTAQKQAPAKTEFIFPEQRNYNVTYFAEKLVTQLDLSFLNAAYQPFMGAYNNPGAGAQFTLSAADLFEDKKITGIIHPGMNGNRQYMLMYDDRTNRLDKQYVFHRQSSTLANGIAAFKILTHEAKYFLKWPFSEVASVRGMANLRYDKFIPLSTDEFFLQLPVFNDYWANLKVEYVFDNTINKGLNILNGTRYKIFAEQFQQVVPTDDDNNGIKERHNMTVLGFDARNYLKIHRDFIWANRIAASTSLGSNKLVYYLGGVDSWLGPKFDYSTQIDMTQNYRYQALATNMRGFIQNARNGKSFAVINSELRLPIFRYLVNKPIKSDFINNFQVVGFGDVGAAWNGPTPYSDENSFNTSIIETNNVIITLKTQKEPVIGGYGFGLRSRIMGYFLRADWAWGVEDYEVQPRIFYLSLSLDF